MTVPTTIDPYHYRRGGLAEQVPGGPGRGWRRGRRERPGPLSPLPSSAGSYRLFGDEVMERFYEIGTEHTLAETSRFLEPPVL